MRTPPGRSIAWLALVAVLATLPYLPTLGASYLADDWFFVHAYHGDRRPFGAFAWRALTSHDATPTTFYRPLAFITLAPTVRAGGSAAGQHAVNVLLHAATAAVVCLLARGLTGGATLPAVVASLAFAWFPRRAEVVAWLSCRPDLLATFFAVASVAAFASGWRTRRRALLAVSLVAWWGALLSKESSVLLPLVHATLAWTGRDAGPARTLQDRSRGEPSPVSWTWLSPFLLSLPLYLVLRRTAIGAWVGGYGAAVLAAGPETMESALKHLAYQVLPPLTVLEPLIATRVGGVATAGFVVAIAALLDLLAWPSRREQATRVGVAWLIAGVLPVVTLPVSLTTTFNDRLLYLPAAGVALLVAALLARARVHAWLGAVLVAGMVLGAWSWTISARWSRAGATSDAVLAALATRVNGDPSPRIYLAAVPDSVGGAYLLRNGVREALAVAGTRGPMRVATLSWYFVDARAPGAAPVTASLDAAGVLTLTSRGGAPQVIVGTPDSTGLVEYEAPASLDRFGRRAFARVHLREPGAVYLVLPDLVQLVEGKGSGGR